MFSKSKRFPEAGKDYIPGPGEYEVLMDDSGRHKRYGFLTQTNRFSEGFDPSISTDHQTLNESTTSTSLTISSTTSLSNRDESSPTSTSKKPLSPLDQGSFEKYKHAMQKEIETLQSKIRKMDISIGALETEKNEAKSALIARDLELADLRSKNAMLQKTIQRQEKSAKSAQWQKKVDGLEQTLQDTKLEHEKQQQTKDKTIDTLNTQLQETESHLHCLKEEQAVSQERSTALEAQVVTLEDQLAASQQDTVQLTQLKLKMEDTIQSLGIKLEAQVAESANLKELNHNLLEQVQTQQETLQQLGSRLTLKDEEIDALLNTIDERDHALQESAALKDASELQFQQYRNYMQEVVVLHLKDKTKSVEQIHIDELNALLTELHEAKRFINKQAQAMDGLKSDVHWLNVQKSQLKELIGCMHKEQQNQCKWNMKRSKQSKYVEKEREEDEMSDTISYSSRSTVSNSHPQTTSLDLNAIVLNDSGFGILTEEIK